MMISNIDGLGLDLKTKSVNSLELNPFTVKTINKKGGELNQGSSPMLFVLDKKGTKMNHTLDGWDIKRGSPPRLNKKTSTAGYLKTIKQAETKSLKQVGENLFIKPQYKKGGLTLKRFQNGGSVEEDFIMWFKQNTPEGKRGIAYDDPDLDYDYYTAWKNKEAEQSGNLHFSSKYKKPNHPTFSDESIYYEQNKDKAGKWVENNGKWEFQASPYNVKIMTEKYGSPENYFKQNDPDATLILPTYKKGGLQVLPRDKEMVEGVKTLLQKVKDKENRKEMLNYILLDFKKEKVKVNEPEFVKQVMLKKGGSYPKYLKLNTKKLKRKKTMEESVK